MSEAGKSVNERFRSIEIEGGLRWGPDGRLWMEGCAVRDLAERFGTPIYVISETRLRENARRFKQVFSERWQEGSFRLLPAIKANYSLALRAILTEEGCGCDVFSEGELWAALQSGLDPGLISLNGNGKLGRSDAMLREAVERGVRITLDHKDEYPVIEAIAREKKRKALIRFRLRPEFRELSAPTDFVPELIPTELAANAYKSGIPTEDLIPLGLRALQSDAVDVTGVHVHLGRHRRSIDFWKGLVKGYAELLGRLKNEWNGWEPREIDMGGGFPIRRDPMGRGIDRSGIITTGLLSALVWAAGRIGGGGFRFRVMNGALSLERKYMSDRIAGDPWADMGPGMEDYADAILGTLRTELKRNGLSPEGKEVQIEPGRALYGDAGIHLARVNFIKRQTKPVRWTWVNVDTTDSFFPDSVLEHSVFRYVFADYHPDGSEAANLMTSDVVGSSCNMDRILADASVPRSVKPGDLIALLDTGAYQDASSSNFNAMGRPATVLVSGENAEIIKKAETTQDVFRRDVVPERLKKA